MTPLRELSESERARRIGNLYRQNNKWYMKVGGKAVYLGGDKALAFATWKAKMLELGKGFTDDPRYFWNSIEQRWDKAETSQSSLKYYRMKQRLKTRKWLISERNRLKHEIIELRLRLDREYRERRAECDQRLKERRAAFEKSLVRLRVEYRARLTVVEQKRFDANRQRIKARVNRRSRLRVEAFQRISRPWKDRHTGLWFSWIGCDHRKLVRLGDDEEKARVVWWVLRSTLNEGAKVLRQPEGVQRTLDELLDINPERVAIRLRQLGWSVSRPTAAASSLKRGQAK